MNRLVNDLLDASRIKHGKLVIRPTQSSLADIVTDAVVSVRQDADRRQQRLDVSVPAYDVAVVADAARVTQIIGNLLSNAVKYTPLGGCISLSVEAPQLTPATRDQEAGTDVVITVTDNGIGIAPSALPDVFDMFVQSDQRPQPAQGGLGIGLAVVKHLVALHNGAVTITSAGEGRGTEVTVHLPIARYPRSDGATPSATEVRPRRILLVDDNVDATEALGMLLTLDGHEVRQANSGEAALATIDSFAPEVALIDIGMRGMDGYQLARLLRRNAKLAAYRRDRPR